MYFLPAPLHHCLADYLRTDPEPIQNENNAQGSEDRPDNARRNRLDYGRDPDPGKVQQTGQDPLPPLPPGDPHVLVHARLHRSHSLIRSLFVVKLVVNHASKATAHRTRPATSKAASSKTAAVSFRLIPLPLLGSTILGTLVMIFISLPLIRLFVPYSLSYFISLHNHFTTLPALLYRA
jgi:hypothetical protein